MARDSGTAVVPCAADGCSPGCWMDIGLPDVGDGVARVSPCQVSPSPGSCMLGHGRVSEPACPCSSATNGGPVHVPRGAEVEADSRCTPVHQRSLPRTPVSSARCYQSHGGSGCLAGDSAAISAAESFLSRYRTASEVGSTASDLAPRFSACEEDRGLDTVDAMLLTPRAPVQAPFPGLEARVSEAGAHDVPQEPGPQDHGSQARAHAVSHGGGSAASHIDEPTAACMASDALRAREADGRPRLAAWFQTPSGEPAALLARPPCLAMPPVLRRAPLDVPQCAARRQEEGRLD
jgi:hypothetical protein